MKISTILDPIDSGHVALPEFQRGYVWNGDQVRMLFTSLYLRRPAAFGIPAVRRDGDSGDHGTDVSRAGGR